MASVDINAILARARRTPGRRKSDARCILEGAFDTLVASPPSWTKLAAELNAQGVRDVSGHKLTGAGLAQTFKRVKAERVAPTVAKAEILTNTLNPPAAPLDEPFRIAAINPKETP
ncbi:MAG TPA: hypothetical protein VGM38_09495 [Pseudolysinimonas sp.]|jgi:hypothetical protein